MHATQAGAQSSCSRCVHMLKGLTRGPIYRLPTQRRMFLSALGPAGLQALLPRAQAVMQAHLAQWEAAGTAAGGRSGGGCIPSLFRQVL